MIHRLYNAQQAHQVFAEVWQSVKATLIAGQQLTLEVKKKTRSNEQNALLHALLSDVAKQREWAGKRREIDTWKRLFVAAWMRAKHEQVELLPALDGHGVDIVYAPTHKLSVEDCSDLISYIEAWHATE